MNIRQFLQHHGIHRNPFAEEDAQTDPVFKEGCIADTFHPAWDKVYGDPREPSTAIVFGRKGSGKTAMRLQVARHLDQFNREHPDVRVYVITYDDFNPFIDRFRAALGYHRRSPEKLLQRWRLWDHIDAILSLGVTSLIDAVTGEKLESVSVPPHRLETLPRHLARDLLLLAICYDQSTAQPVTTRWHKLRRKLKYRNLAAYGPQATGILTSVLWLIAVITLFVQGRSSWFTSVWYLWLAALAGGWAWYGVRWLRETWRAMGIRRRARVLRHTIGTLRERLLSIPARDLTGQPLPDKDSTDDRYELLIKFQTVLKGLGYHGVIVLVDRVDEPEWINGLPERMKALVWPMFDNKFLKHPGLGIKMMLPAELKPFIDREDTAFYERARLDKQNLIPSFEWTPEALLDVANARIRACSDRDPPPMLTDLLDSSIELSRLLQALHDLRVPRHLFKFAYRMFVAHCNAHSESEPVWRVQPQTFETELALYLREQDAFERGVGAG